MAGYTQRQMYNHVWAVWRYKRQQFISRKRKKNSEDWREVENWLAMDLRASEQGQPYILP
jgi:hypothetical protein